MSSVQPVHGVDRPHPVPADRQRGGTGTRQAGTQPAGTHLAGTHLAVTRRGGRIGVEQVPSIVPGPGELVIAPEVAGLCGTDLQIIRGERDEPALVLGHEGVGRVVEVGPGVDPRLVPGTRVTVNPTHPRDPSFLLGHLVDGFLQERTLIAASAVAAGLVLPVPPELDVRLAPLLEPLAVAGYALGELGRCQPDALLVVGAGTVGHLLVRAAPHRLGPGIRTVLVHHRSSRAAGPRGAEGAGHLDIGMSELGPLPGVRRLAVALATPRTATLAALDRVLAGQPAVVAVDIIGGLPAGARSALLPGVDLAAARAATCGGVPSPAHRVHVSGPAGTPVELFGHRGVSDLHLAHAAAELVRRPDHYRDLITHTASLQEAAAIMRHLSTSRDRTVQGRRLVKLGITVARPPAPASAPAHPAAVTADDRAGEATAAPSPRRGQGR